VQQPRRRHRPKRHADEGGQHQKRGRRRLRKRHAPHPVGRAIKARDQHQDAKDRPDPQQIHRDDQDQPEPPDARAPHEARGRHEVRMGGILHRSCLLRLLLRRSLDCSRGRGNRACLARPPRLFRGQRASSSRRCQRESPSHVVGQARQIQLPSRHVTEGPARAPHRSYFYAMGLNDEEIHQPFVGVATCWNEAAPCNIALNRQAQSVKIGVKRPAARRANSPPSP
jgi:hypothetical protein